MHSLVKGGKPEREGEGSKERKEIKRKGRERGGTESGRERGKI